MCAYLIVADSQSEHAYEPFGAARDLFAHRAPELAIAGPAGTGKTRACLEKLDIAAWKYPGMRAAMVRKTRRSMTQSVMVTFGTKVLRGAHVRFRASSQDYLYPNGSQIVLAGMDKASKILSSEFDLVYVNQAEELSEDDLEILTTRLRHGVMPYQQLLVDVNPSAPTHHLRRRMDDGRMYELLSRHEDNPLLYDRRQGQWTAEGERYVLGVLERLSGVRYWRLRHGRWVAAEGAVYEEFDRGVHLVYADAVARASLRYYVAGVDWGFTNPGVIQVWGVDADGRVYRVHEVYHTQRLIDWWVAEARRLHARYQVQAFVCDPSGAANIAEFRNAGLPVVAGFNDIGRGIQAVKARLKAATDGRPRLFLLRDATSPVDNALLMAERPWCTEMEFDVYVFPRPAGGGLSAELPIDADNHGLDTMRYVVAHVDGIGRSHGWARGAAA